MPVGKRESMHWGAAQRYFAVLPDFQSLNMDLFYIHLIVADTIT